MSDGTRSQRTIGATHTLTDQDRQALAVVRTHPGYQVLLDVMEQVCAMQESALINRDVADRAGILAEHRKTQAAWQIFEHMQGRVDAEIRQYSESILPKPEALYSDQELDDYNLLDPTIQTNPTP